MNHQLVLSLFPGADLLGRAFEAQGFSVVRGPEVMLGQDIRAWNLPPAETFTGIIGGPPCQSHSVARHIGGAPARHPDLIPEFWDIVQQLRPAWAVMENVPGVLGHAGIPPEAVPIKLRDWECGGHTSRTRLFYFWPGRIAPVELPQRRPGKPQHTVLASSYKTGGRRAAKHMHAGLCPEDAGHLQGWPEIAATMSSESNKARIFPQRFIVHCLGNGVPRAMGEFVAKAIIDATKPQQNAKTG